MNHEGPTYMDQSAFAALLDSQRNTTAVVDCRDLDRREGGWVIDSIHFPSQEATEEAFQKLFSSLQERNVRQVVFHCMFSQSRGPGCAKSFAFRFPAHVRGDMKVSILQGGFRGFYAWARHHNREDLVVKSPYNFM